MLTKGFRGEACLVHPASGGNKRKFAELFPPVNPRTAARFFGTSPPARWSRYMSIMEVGMAIKTILVSLNETDRAASLMQIASGLADKHDAHLIGLYVIPAVYIHPGISMHVTPDVIDFGRRFFEDRRKDSKQLFADEMNKQGFKGEWREVEGATHIVADAVVEHGRQADLIITSQGGSDSNNGSEVDFAERVIVESGRPVLVIPRIGKFNTIANNVVFGWNATRESARAAFDALPLLAESSTARIVWVDANLSDGNVGMLPGAELATALARHGIETVSEPVTAPDIDPADALLNRVSDASADMLVMGAYGHSRLREFVFGGATRKVLDQMTVPVLMSH